jgi:endonuclease YncB( thermonuclease family)
MAAPRWPALLVLAASLADADPSRGQAPACRLDTLGSGDVRAVTDGRTFLLDDGREFRLAGIEVPLPAEVAAAAGPRAPSATVSPPSPAAPAADFGLEAKIALERLILDKSVVLKGTSAADRHGRVPAQVFLGSAGLERSVQQDMLQRGLARVAARVGEAACTAPLLAAEREARNAKRGLWGDPRYAARQADEPAAVLAERGQFAVVEGRVLSVRESGGTVYLNFGRRWTEDFTVTIAKRNERIFAMAGLEPKRLERLRIRVRGFVEVRGGPWIEATRPEQIEVIGR